MWLAPQISDFFGSLLRYIYPRHIILNSLIINYLTLTIQAAEVKNVVQAGSHHTKLGRQLDAIVPPAAILEADHAVVYALTSTGSITRLPMTDGLPFDDNDLNNALGEVNSRLSDLLEIELAAANA